MRPTTFIVGTGRSGSSALSRILHTHPGILSLNEMLAALTPVALPEGEVPGTEFWAILSGPNGIFDLMIRSDAALPEFLYPKRPGRHSAENGIPALSLMTLPPLTDDPDAALDELGAIVPDWPTRPVGEHYAALFEHLSARYGGEVVVERSGYSVGWIPRLREVFPEARFVHLYRGGPDCAMSMSRHPGYRMIYHLRLMVETLGLDAITELDADNVAKLPPELAGLLADPFDRRLLMDAEVPVANFGRLWSEIVTEGVESLRGLPPERVTTLSYEDLIAAPERELARLAAFTGAAADAEWIARGAASLDASRHGAALRLPPEELAALREACAPGEAALAEG
ncbi:MAG TPA: hypothetical protein VGF17_10330 [Phytomonospora sp.]